MADGAAANATRPEPAPQPDFGKGIARPASVNIRQLSDTESTHREDRADPMKVLLKALTPLVLLLSAALIYKFWAGSRSDPDNPDAEGDRLIRHYDKQRQQDRQQQER
ncbi:hypothetical protein C7446_1381 [Kushneria sinocarnis]|uniref:Uncharacterized protein n=1 Tax=Kushneria sinocarnis TaxID=595502 RepID=A0A420WWR1_9GAMM|nr:hypothetical protein [Kushneria sinocarnis]RKR04181.1 hypothetical protein C7446_1381 [Kushneria sinocarnis]